MIETEAKQTKSTRIQQRKYQEAEPEKCLQKKKRTSIAIMFLIHNWHLPQIRESNRYNYWPQMIPRYTVSG